MTMCCETPKELLHIETQNQARYIAYVCGPYSADSIEERNANIAAADAAGRDLLAMGYAVIVPHNNTRAWEEDTRFKHGDFITMDLTLLERCDLLCVVDESTDSPGARTEIDWAEANRLPVYPGVANVPPPHLFRTRRNPLAQPQNAQKRDVVRKKGILVGTLVTGV